MNARPRFRASFLRSAWHCSSSVAKKPRKGMDKGKGKDKDKGKGALTTTIMAVIMSTMRYRHLLRSHGAKKRCALPRRAQRFEREMARPTTLLPKLEQDRGMSEKLADGRAGPRALAGCDRTSGDGRRHWQTAPHGEPGRGNEPGLFPPASSD